MVSLGVYGPYTGFNDGYAYWYFLPVTSNTGLGTSPPTYILDPTKTIDSNIVNSTISSQWTVPSGVTTLYGFTIVGGGGSGCAVRTDGEYARACGGGSGYVTTNTTQRTLTPGNAISVTVGAGGPVFVNSTSTRYSISVSPGSSYTGSVSSITVNGTTYTANGGGYGRGGWGSSLDVGGSGGSAGGGGCGGNGEYNGLGTLGSAPCGEGQGQGSPLSLIDGILRAGGGGGSTIDTRTSTTYAIGTGGSGGGGNAAIIQSGNVTASSGLNGYGGGGGAAAGGYGTMTSGAGGCGIIILKTNIPTSVTTGISLTLSSFTGISPFTPTILTTLSDTFSNFKLLYGDGTSYTSTLCNTFSTTHTYTNFGKYHVYAEGYYDGKIYIADTNVTVYQNDPITSFTYSQIANKISFNNTSTNSNEYFWDFGDGSNSTAAFPTHIYELPGSYTVTLYASNQVKNTFTSSIATISNPTPLVSINSVALDDYTIPSKFQFFPSITTNSSIHETVSSITWTIDGSTYTQNSPTVYFNSAGTKTITCTVTNNYGVTSPVATTTINLDYAPVANFKPASKNIITGTVSASVTFTNLTFPTTCTYLWNFGDGTTSTNTNPTHSFASFGNYTVSLTATNSVGASATKIYTNCINIHRKVKYLTDTVITHQYVGEIYAKSLGDKVTAVASHMIPKVLIDKVTGEQDQTIDDTGLEEDSSRTISTTFDEWGHIIINKISDIGARVIKAVTFDNKSFQVLKVKELEDEITVDDTELTHD